MLNWDCRIFLDKLDSNLKALNANILICLFWRLMEGFLSAMPADISMVSNSLCGLFYEKQWSWISCYKTMVMDIVAIFICVVSVLNVIYAF